MANILDKIFLANNPGKYSWQKFPAGRTNYIQICPLFKLLFLDIPGKYSWQICSWQIYSWQIIPAYNPSKYYWQTFPAGQTNYIQVCPLSKLLYKYSWQLFPVIIPGKYSRQIFLANIPSRPNQLYSGLSAGLNKYYWHAGPIIFRSVCCLSFFYKYFQQIFQANIPGKYSPKIFLAITPGNYYRQIFLAHQTNYIQVHLLSAEKCPRETNKQ